MLKWFFQEERKLLFLEKSALRHAIYNNPDCVQAMVEWLEEVNLLGRKEDLSEKAKRKANRDNERDVSARKFW